MKFKIKLSTALWVLFAGVILIEAAVLYRALFSAPDAGPAEVPPAEAETAIDPAELAGLKSWLEARRGGLPAVGTPNPFAEYK